MSHAAVIGLLLLVVVVGAIFYELGRGERDAGRRDAGKSEDQGKKEQSWRDFL